MTTCMPNHQEHFILREIRFKWNVCWKIIDMLYSKGWNWMLLKYTSGLFRICISPHLYSPTYFTGIMDCSHQTCQLPHSLLSNFLQNQKYAPAYLAKIQNIFNTNKEFRTEFISLLASCTDGQSYIYCVMLYLANVHCNPKIQCIS